jgi:fused signal recognition particle receptor
MFGSNDDKKTPAAAGEKKGLFGWLRKKPQETVVEQPQQLPEAVPEPVIEAAPVAQASAPMVLPGADPVFQPVAEPEPVAETLQAPEVEHKPWLVLPVAEEPVSLVEDELAPHITPLIAESVVVEPDIPESVIAAFVAPQPAPVPVAAPVITAAPVASVPAAPIESPVVAEPARAGSEENKVGFFARLKQGLSKTSASIGEGMASLFLGKKLIDDELLEDIETRLLIADVGVEATSVIIQSLTQKVARKQLADADALYKSLQAELRTCSSQSSSH